MPGNRIGRALTLTSWGESHGSAIGGVLDGLPPDIRLDERKIQIAMARRRPGSSSLVTQRREPDAVELLSGLYQGRTTGHPLAFLIRNQDARPKDYDEIARLYRPGHADWSWQQKYGIRDPRGGGRSSARETAVRVAAGAVALQILRHFLGEKVQIRGALAELGGDSVPPDQWDWEEAARNPLFAPSARAAERWTKAIEKARREQSSLGAIAEIHAIGIPPGLGEPVYDRLDAEIAKALMSINAVKAVEIGAGLQAARLRGEDNLDSLMQTDPEPVFASNRAGGILGGISTGQDIIARFALKPTSSIPRPLPTVDEQGKTRTIRTKGRHDPCVGIRAVPVGEAMMALVLADHLLRHRGQTGRIGGVAQNPGRRETPPP